MTNISKKKFGAYIRKTRESKGISREELSKKLFVSYSVVLKWENGLRYPDFEMIIKISELLEITVQDIIDHSKEEKKQINPTIIKTLIFIGVGTAVLLGIYLGVINRAKREQSLPMSNESLIGTDKIGVFVRVNSTTQNNIPIIIIGDSAIIMSNMDNGNNNPFKDFINGDLCSLEICYIIEEGYPAHYAISNIQFLKNIYNATNREYTENLNKHIEKLKSLGYSVCENNLMN